MYLGVDFADIMFSVVVWIGSISAVVACEFGCSLGRCEFDKDAISSVSLDPDNEVRYCMYFGMDFDDG